MNTPPFCPFRCGAVIGPNRGSHRAPPNHGLNAPEPSSSSNPTCVCGTHNRGESAQSGSSVEKNNISISPVLFPAGLEPVTFQHKGTTDATKLQRKELIPILCSSEIVYMKGLHITPPVFQTAVTPRTPQSRNLYTPGSCFNGTAIYVRETHNRGESAQSGSSVEKNNISISPFFSQRDSNQ